MTASDKSKAAVTSVVNKVMGMSATALSSRCRTRPQMPQTRTASGMSAARLPAVCMSVFT